MFIKKKKLKMKTSLSNNIKYDIVVACPVMKNNKNISMMVRSASCFGASKIIITGNNKVNQHISRHCGIEIEYRNSIDPVIKNYKTLGYHIIALEQCQDSKNLHEFSFPDIPLLIVVGNEVRGMDKDIMCQAHDIVEIPLYNEPYSLNVAMSLSICMSEIVRQREKKEYYNYEKSR